MHIFNSKKVTTIRKNVPKNIIFYTHYFTFSYIVQTTTNSSYNKMKFFKIIVKL